MRPLSQDLRQRIIAARERGEGTGEVCRHFSVSRKSVERFWKQHRLTGECRPRQIGGYRRRKLSSDQLNVLRDLLSQGAAAHGWSNDLWTIKRVVEVIRRHFSIVYSQSNGYHILTNYLGWSPQRPITRLRERDNAQIERWEKESFPRILLEAEQRKATLVFVDESGFLLAPTLRRTFAPRGSRPVVKVSDPHGRISAIGAIAIDPSRKHLRVLYQFLPDNANFNGYLVVQFVDHVCGKINGQITVVWDSIPIHSTKLMEDYLKKTSRLVIEQFPPYAPELNPIDKVWAYLKYGRLANYTPSNLIDLRTRLNSEIAELANRQEILAGCVRGAGLASALA
jgi:transposase